MIVWLLFCFQAPYYTDPINPQMEWERMQAMRANDAILLEEWIPTVVLYTELGSLNCLLEPLEVLVETFPESPGLAEAMLIAYATSGEDEKAIQIGEQACRQFPTQASLHFNLALVYANAQALPEALNLLIAALENGLSFRTQYWQHIMNWLQQLHPEGMGVVAVLQEKAKANPNSQALRLLIAVQLVRVGRLDQAAKLMDAMPEYFANPDFKRFILHLKSFSQ